MEIKLKHDAELRDLLTRSRLLKAQAAAIGDQLREVHRKLSTLGNSVQNFGKKAVTAALDTRLPHRT